MLVFKPTYSTGSIAQEIRKEICGKITERLSELVIRELEQERLSEARDSLKAVTGTKGA